MLDWRRCEMRQLVFGLFGGNFLLTFARSVVALHGRRCRAGVESQTRRDASGLMRFPEVADVVSPFPADNSVSIRLSQPAQCDHTYRRLVSSPCVMCHCSAAAAVLPRNVGHSVGLLSRNILKISSWGWTSLLRLWYAEATQVGLHRMAR